MDSEQTGNCFGFHKSGLGGSFTRLVLGKRAKPGSDPGKPDSHHYYRHTFQTRPQEWEYDVSRGSLYRRFLRPFSCNGEREVSPRAVGR